MAELLLITYIDWYCVFLECILCIYLLGMLILQKGWLQEVICNLASPLLYPIQKLMKNSILQSKVDFSAIISFMVILFFRAFLKK